jgi:selenocysteine-specific elongation factor
MLASLGPVAAVMVVVAADGGWMPQSAEHLAAIDALGVRHGVLVVAPPALRRGGGGAAAARELAGWPAAPRAGDLLRRHEFLRAGTLAAMGVPDMPEPVAGDWLIDPERWARLREALSRAVAEFTVRDLLAPGMPVEAARGVLGLPSRDLIIPLAAASGGTAGETATLDGGYLRPTGSPGPGSLPPRVAEAIQRVLRGLTDDPFAAPDARRLRELRLDGKALAAAARGGLLLRVADQVVLAPGADSRAVAILAELPQPFTMSQARQALGITRRVAVPLLEYLACTRRTERLPGDLHRLRG